MQNLIHRKIVTIEPDDSRLQSQNPDLGASLIRIKDPSSDPSSSKRTTVFVNGILFSDQTLARNVKKIAREISPDFYLVLNRMDGGPGVSLAKAVFNSVRGICSHNHGYAAEREACSVLEDLLISKLESNQPIRIIAYSQGALITSNVLAKFVASNSELIHSRLPLITVESYGGAAVNWPKEIRVHSYRNLEDRVPDLAEAWCKFAFSVTKKAVGLDTNHHNLESLRDPLRAHDLRYYLSRTHLFFEDRIQKISSLNSKHLARVAVGLLINHNYAEPFFIRLINHRAEAGDHSFLQTFVRYAERAGIGAESNVFRYAEKLLDKISDAAKSSASHHSQS